MAARRTSPRRRARGRRDRAGRARAARRAVRISPSGLPDRGIALGGIGPDIDETVIEVGSGIGVVLLLFMLGLEYTATSCGPASRHRVPRAGRRRAQRPARRRAGAAAGLGAGGGRAAGRASPTSRRPASSRRSSATSAGWQPRRPRSILSILVLEDLAMAVYLPIVAALLAGDGWPGRRHRRHRAWRRGPGPLVAVRFGPAHLTRCVSATAPTKPAAGGPGLTLLVAGAAQQLQVSAAVGAFLVGVALSGAVAEGAQRLLARCATCSRPSSSCSSACRSTPREPPAGALPGDRPGGGHRLHQDRLTGWLGRPPGRVAARGRWRAGARWSPAASSPS